MWIKLLLDNWCLLHNNVFRNVIMQQTSLKKLILFTLSSEIDLFREEEDNYYSYSFLYARLKGYSSSSIRDAVLQLVDKGQVDKISKSGRVRLRLTSRGKNRLLAEFAAYKNRKKIWDNKWRIVIIRGKSRLKKPEKRTERITNLRDLRLFLRDNSFKKYIRGVYIYPFAVSEKMREFLLNERFSNLITIAETSSLIVGDSKQLAKSVWSLEKLMNEYDVFIKRVDSLIINLKNKKVLKNQEKNKFSLILKEMFSLLKKDPGLPKKLLLSGWPALKARTKFLELAKLVKNCKFSN